MMTTKMMARPVFCRRFYTFSLAVASSLILLINPAVELCAVEAFSPSSAGTREGFQLAPTILTAAAASRTGASISSSIRFKAFQLIPISSPASAAATSRTTHSTSSGTRLYAEGSVFEVEVDIPPSNSGVSCKLKFGSILSVPSEIVEVRYKLPFGLNVEPKKNFAVVTKGHDSGDETKERTGDILRYTSQWTMGLPDGDGLAATAGFFSGGGVTWRCTMFDVMKAKDWSRVVEALTSNVPARTDEVVMLFERPLEPPPEMQ
jgi:hypothetical protein